MLTRRNSKGRFTKSSSGTRKRNAHGRFLRKANRKATRKNGRKNSRKASRKASRKNNRKN